jgi:hypothetical protein
VISSSVIKNRVSDPTSGRVDPALRYIAEKKLGQIVADACGVSRQAVSQWHQVPPHHVAAVSEVLRMPTCHIRPTSTLLPVARLAVAGPPAARP